MYTKEQEEIALKEYKRLGSVHAVIRRLGYPSKSTLYRWYERRNAGPENRHGHAAEIPEKFPIHFTGCIMEFPAWSMILGSFPWFAWDALADGASSFAECPISTN